MTRAFLSAAILAGIVLCGGIAAAQGVAMDPSRSAITVYAYKSGLFSAFAHDHIVEAPIQRGEVRLSGDRGVEFVVDARRMKVLDPKLSADKRAEVQSTMHSEVLESHKYPEIRFRSTAVQSTGPAAWVVRGDLEMHGVSRPVTVTVAQSDGVFRGRAKIKQRDFGIKPVSLAGGTIKVKDEVAVEFLVRLAEDAQSIAAGR